MEALLSSLAPRLHRFGKRLCDSYAEDALQDSLLTIAEELPGFRGDSEISTWAYSILRNACGRLLRGKNNTHTVPLKARQEEPSHQLDPERAMLHEERREAFNCAMHSLPSTLREVVLLRDVEELSAQEAARTLSISVPALKSRLHRARSALSKALDEGLEVGHSKGACPDVLSAVSRRYEDELNQRECDELEAHLAKCRNCDECCERLKRAFAEGRAIARDERELTAIQKCVLAAYEHWSRECAELPERKQEQ
jgi:RNA polymerase sigma-70 factor (ECF subfamily)